MIRSLQASFKELTDTPDFTDEVRERALNMLDLAFKPQIAEIIWPQTRQIILELSPKMEHSGYWDSWQPYLDRGLALSRTVQDKQAEGAIGVQIGIFQQRQGKVASAVEWYEWGMACAQAVDDKEVWAIALNRLGFTASQQYKVTEASDYIQQALELLSEDNPKIEFCYYVLGNIALCVHEPAKAAQYFRQSIDICQRTGDKHRMGINLNNLGNALHEQGMSKDALEIFAQAIQLWTEIENPVELAITKMNQGIVHDDLNKPFNALKCYSEAKPILEKSSNSANLAKLYNNQGYSYSKLEKWCEAKTLYQASLIQFQQIEHWLEYASVLDGLGLIYLKQGQLHKAAKTFEDALQILSDLTEDRVQEYLFQEITEHLQEAYMQLT
ncbi:MAG: tetratricopeptide repeat protein [Chloroflexota bacterium]